MANPFQPTPSYGSPYGSSPYYPHQLYPQQQQQQQQHQQHQQQNHQQYPVQQPAHSPPAYQPYAMPPMAALHASPTPNMGRVEANSHIPPAQRFQFPPAPFNPDMLKHFANPNIHPPPLQSAFPPVPFPNLGLPHFPPNFPHTNTPSFPLPPHDNQAEDPDAYDPRYPQNLIPSPSRQPDKPASASNHNYSQPMQQRPSQEEDSPSSRTISHEDQHLQPVRNQPDIPHPPNNNASIFSLQKHVPTQPLAENTSSQPPPSITSHLNIVQPHTQASAQNQPKPASPKTLPVQKPLNPFQPQHDAQYQPAPNSKPFQRHYENKTVPELRQLAKGALLSLVPHSIHYADLVKEGIDSRTLALLYKELGIKFSENVLDARPNGIPPPVDRSEDTPAPPNTVIPAQLEVPASAVPSMDAVDRPVPAVSPSLERKDRIAQLLAAKAGRPNTPARSVTDSVGSAGPLEVPQTQPASTNITISATASANPDSKADAQQAKSALQGLSQAETPEGNLEHPRQDSELQPPLERRSTDGGALPNPFSSSIPGLFMTTDDRMQLKSAQASAVASFSNRVRVASTSQKRRRSSDNDDQSFAPDSKRQNTTSDLDEGEVMAIDSPSDDGGSEGEISDDKPLIASARQSQETGTFRSPQLQRSQSATELPTTVLGDQRSNTGFVNETSSIPLPKPFGTTAVTGMTAAQISERAEMLKARFLKQRAARQQALQDGLPSLNAEVNKTGTLLTEKRNSLRQVEHQIMSLNLDIDNAEKRKQEITKEIAELERQFQDGVTGQRQYNDELRKLSTDQSASSLPISKAKATLEPPSTEAVIESYTPAEGPSESGGQTSRDSALSGDDAFSPDHVMENTDQRPVLSLSEGNTRPGSTDSHPSAWEPSVQVADMARDDEAEFPTQAAPKDSTDPRNFGGDVFPGDRSHFEDDANLLRKTEPDSNMPNIPGTDGDSDGSASMSDSGSEGTEDEYEPADPASLYPLEIDDDGSDEYDPEEAPVDPTPPAVQVHETEDYEPAENIVTEQELPFYDLEPSSVKDPILTNGSVLHSNSDARAAIQLDGAAYSPPVGVPMVSLQRRSTSTMGAVQPLSNEGTAHQVNFAPYQSPLSNLKSFRYNEQFKGSAKEGFRSLTYSNTIDPNVPLCQTELNGGVCQDATCEEQHFRKFQLTDDQILVQMSSNSDIPDKETRDSFTKGLKELIAELRSRNVKEFENVANELSHYRRRFFAGQEAV